MNIHSNAPDLKTYIKEKRKILNELYILPYVSKDELKTLSSCENEIAVDNFAHKLVNKYYDIMMEDFEREPEQPDIDPMIIATSTLSSRVINILTRAKFVTFYEVIDFIDMYGLKSIKGLGAGAIKELFDYVDLNLSDFISLENYKEIIA